MRALNQNKSFTLNGRALQKKELKKRKRKKEEKSLLPMIIKRCPKYISSKTPIIIVD